MSIWNDALYRNHFSGYPLHPPEGTLSTYDSTEIPLEGMVHLPVTFQSETIQNFPFYVTRSGSSLMGLDLFDQLGFQVSKNGVIIQYVDIVSAFPSVFTGFGKIARFVHRPRVKPEVTPVSQCLHRLPFSVLVSRELKRLQDDGMIEPIDSSPWISNLVVARRKSGEIRLCVDLKAINEAIIPDKYPLPMIEELSAEFPHSTVFTKLDTRRSYQQVPMAEDSKYLTAFITHGFFLSNTAGCRMD